MSYEIKFNEPLSYRDFYLNTDRQIKSSKLQDFLKKDREETSENNQEIAENVENYKENLKVVCYINSPLISLGTLSLKMAERYYSNSDSMSRKTHIFVKMIAIRLSADDKSLFDKYVYVSGTQTPKLGYRDEIGAYTTNKDFYQLNQFIKFLLNGKIDLTKYKCDEMKPYQYVKFMRQLDEANKFIKECNLTNDEERLNWCDNVLSLYEVTFDKIENEIKVARTTNRHGTPNRFPYHLQNKLSDFIYTNYKHLDFSEEQQKLLEDVLVEASGWLGSYLIDCNEEPTIENFAKWCTWINKSLGVKGVNKREKNYTGGSLNMIEEEWKSEIQNIFETEKTLDEKIDDLEYFLNKEHNFILTSMEKISNYKRNHKSISANFYPIMLMKEHNEPLTNEEYAILKFHTQIDRVCKNLYPTWSKWQSKILEKLQLSSQNKQSLTSILKEILIYDDSEFGNWYDEVTRDMIYGEYKSQSVWSAFSLIDKILGYSSFSYTEKGGIIDLISGFKMDDNFIRTLEHWAPKSTHKIYGFKGANMFYLRRSDNLEKSDNDIKTKLKGKFQDLQTTLPIIFGLSSGSLSPSISNLTNTDEWKNTFNKNIKDTEWVAEIVKDYSVDSNHIYNLRIEQLKLCVEMLHNE